MSGHPENSISPDRMREYLGDILRDVAIAFTVLEAVAIALRYVSLRVSKKRFGLDDILAVPALLFCLGMNIVSFLALEKGRVGYHLDVVEARYPEAFVTLAKVLVATPIMYSAACAFPRIMLLSLYLRIFTLQKSYRIACYTLIALVVALAVSDILAGAFQCTPIAYLWDKTIKGGHCIDIPQFFRYGTLPNVIIDLLMLVLPQPVVWKLHSPTHVKVGLALTFLTGSVGMVTSIVRCVTFFRNDPLTDGTWNDVTFLNWGIIEPGVYLIAACLPCYRPLVQLIIDWYRRRSSQSNSTGSPQPPLSRGSLHNQGGKSIIKTAAYSVEHADRRQESDEYQLRDLS
ncbi:hypothetical protein BDW69DRAFT_199121 [Aspergillus filifer]